MNFFSFKKTISFLTLITFFTFVFLQTSKAQISELSSPTVFANTLVLGNDSVEVARLKEVLNSNPLTKIEKSGLLEEKASYFGPDTRRAVIKFQELYKDTVLFPLGLTKGTGVVGANTRLKLNELAKGVNLQRVSDENALKLDDSDSENESLVVKLRQLLGISVPVVVNKVENYQVSPQGTVVLNGSGFLSGQNTVIIDGTHHIDNVSSLTGATLRFKLPKEVSLGKHTVWVTNSNGTSRNSQAEVYFVVTENPVPPPQITKISPHFATHEDEIVISGKGFTANNNNLYTTLGNLKNIRSSDGVTLKANMAEFEHIDALAKNPELKGTTHKMWAYVQNENGASASPFMFTIKIQ